MQAYMEFPTKYSAQAEVYSKLHFEFIMAHGACKWDKARKFSRRLVRVKNWCLKHGFKFNA